MKTDMSPIFASKEETVINQKIAGVINDWISESRETRRVEKAFSDERISAWKIIPSGGNLEAVENSDVAVV